MVLSGVLGQVQACSTTGTYQVLIKYLSGKSGCSGKFRHALRQVLIKYMAGACC